MLEFLYPHIVESRLVTKPVERMILLYLARDAGPCGSVSMSHRRLCSLVGCSRSTCVRSISSLASLGVLLVERTLGDVNDYRFNFDALGSDQ